MEQFGAQVLCHTKENNQQISHTISPASLVPPISFVVYPNQKHTWKKNLGNLDTPGPVDQLWSHQAFLSNMYPGPHSPVFNFPPISISIGSLSRLLSKDCCFYHTTIPNLMPLKVLPKMSTLVLPLVSAWDGWMGLLSLPEAHWAVSAGLPLGNHSSFPSFL